MNSSMRMTRLIVVPAIALGLFAFSPAYLARTGAARFSFSSSQDFTVTYPDGGDGSEDVVSRPPSSNRQSIGRLLARFRSLVGASSNRLTVGFDRPGTSPARRHQQVTFTATAAVRKSVSAHLGCAFGYYDDDGYYYDWTYEARLFDPGNNQIQYQGNWHNSSGINGTIEKDLVDPDEGTYTCEARFWVYTYELPSLRGTQNVSYGVPSGESTFGNAWSTNATIYKWRATLSGGNYTGRAVSESGGGTANGDTCYFSGSGVMPFNQVTGGPPWSIASDNTYGDDFVGWYSSVVDYYRMYGPTMPCMTDFYQVMSINRPGTSNAAYKTNWLKAGMTSTTVWSERDGHSVSKSY